MGCALRSRLLNGPRHGIAPFPELSEGCRLPHRSRLIDLYCHLVPNIDRIPYQSFPDKRESADRVLMQRLFRRAGLGAKDARAATTALIPLPERVSTPRRNPAQQKCLERFVQGLSQPDIVKSTFKSALILTRLKRFGLTKTVYYRVKDERFVPRTLKRTAENLQQIERMATALHLDPEPISALLMGGKR